MTTTPLVSQVQCRPIGPDRYLAFVDGKDCIKHTRRFNHVVHECTGFQGRFGCGVIGGNVLMKDTSGDWDSCIEAANLLNANVQELEWSQRKHASKTATCIDMADWSDSRGLGCSAYTKSTECDRGDKYATSTNANVACCACGGGKSLGTFDCDPDGWIKELSKTCDSIDPLNRALDAWQDGSLDVCKHTSPTTTLTTTESFSVSSTASVSASTTVTTTPEGVRLTCRAYRDVTYIKAVGCAIQALQLNNLLASCMTTHSTVPPPITCKDVGGDSMLFGGVENCSDIVNALNYAQYLRSMHQPHGGPSQNVGILGTLMCTVSGYLRPGVDTCTAGVNDAVDKLTDAVEGFLDGSFTECRMSTISTTFTTSETSSASKSATTTASTTVSLSISSTLSTTESSTATTWGPSGDETKVHFTMRGNFSILSSRDVAFIEDIIIERFDKQNISCLGVRVSAGSIVVTSYFSAATPKADISRALPLVVSPQLVILLPDDTILEPNDDAIIVGELLPKTTCHIFGSNEAVISTPGVEECKTHIYHLNNLIEACTGRRGRWKCSQVDGSGAYLKAEDLCDEEIIGLNLMMHQYTRFLIGTNVPRYLFQCSRSGFLKVNVTSSTCDTTTQNLNLALGDAQSNTFRECLVSTPTTTVTTTPTSSISNTVSSSPSLSATSTGSTSISSTITTSLRGKIVCEEYSTTNHLTVLETDDCDEEVRNLNALIYSCGGDVPSTISTTASSSFSTTASSTQSDTFKSELPSRMKRDTTEYLIQCSYDNNGLDVMHSTNCFSVVAKINEMLDRCATIRDQTPGRVKCGSLGGYDVIIADIDENYTCANAALQMEQIAD